MKTTKFRVWNGERMISIASKTNDTSIIFNEWGWEVIDHLKGILESIVQSWENNDAELMQFIGLLDENKKEIYEGDILQQTIDNRLFNWLVVFKNGCFGIVNIGVNGYLGDFYSINSKYYFIERVIIGNMYENPELLK